jgi:alpha-galactosidase
MAKNILRYPTLFLVNILFLALLFSCQSGEINKENSTPDTVPLKNVSLALKPPMGWNSWDCYGWAVTEAEVRANANYMSTHLKSLGYEYIVIDMGWYADSAASDFEAFVHETIPVKPHYTLDEYGRLLPDPVKYPSSAGGKGFKPLADYVHSLGLKFGVHLLRGIPWETAEKNLTIKGTSIGASSIAQPLMGCVWYDGFYGVDMTKPGAQEYYDSVFELFADWGVDFVKVDDVVNIPEFEGISKASRKCKRDIVLSVVPDGIPEDVLRENAHMARTGYDFWDVWQMLKVGFPVAASAVKISEPGYWPDLDMLPIGKIGIKISYKGPDPRISNFNKEELHSLLSLWYISKMPLFIGGNLPETDSLTYELITNKEALDVNRNSTNNRQIKFKNAIIIWTADIPDSKDKYLAFFNQWESKIPVNIRVNFDQLGLDPSTEYFVRDLWEKKDVGSFRNEFSYPVMAHGAGLYRVSAKE